MKVYVALHEERYPLAVFSAPERAHAWISEQDERDYTFTVEECDVDSGGAGDVTLDRYHRPEREPSANPLKEFA